MTSVAELEVPSAQDNTARTASIDLLVEKVGTLTHAVRVLSERLPPSDDACGGAIDGQAVRRSEASLSPRETRGDVGDAKRVEVAFDIAKKTLARHQQRNRRLGDELFSDPAWEMLLELYIARVNDQNFSVGSVCIASAVPLTSALRWCKQLQQRELVRRERDPRDGRRVFLKLTDSAFAELTEILCPEN